MERVPLLTVGKLIFGLFVIIWPGWRLATKIRETNAHIEKLVAETKILHKIQYRTQVARKQLISDLDRLEVWGYFWVNLSSICKNASCSWKSWFFCVIGQNWPAIDLWDFRIFSLFSELFSRQKVQTSLRIIKIPNMKNFAESNEFLKRDKWKLTEFPKILKQQSNHLETWCVNFLHEC